MTHEPETPSTNARPAQGLQRIVAATRYSLAGLVAAWRSEAAFRQELVAAVILVPGAYWLGTNAMERVLLTATVLLVLIVELLNSAIECTVDRIGTDRHPLSGRAKDMGSAAVMLSLILWALTWGDIAWQRFVGA
jgi:diacylglycerol kinase (ATP)